MKPRHHRRHCWANGSKFRSDLSAQTHYLSLVRPYAGWAALTLFVVGTFVGLVAAEVMLPLLLLSLGSAFAAFRYWEDFKILDIWRLDEWMRTRVDSLGIREWYSLDNAAQYYCDPGIVDLRNHAAAEMNTIMMELIKSSEQEPPGQPEGRPFSNNHPIAENHARYDAAQAKYALCTVALARELHEQLTRGTLLAKGSLAKNNVSLAERIIPTSRWRVMTLDMAKGNASGGGWHYTRILIGKKAAVAQQPPTSKKTADRAGAEPARTK